MKPVSRQIRMSEKVNEKAVTFGNTFSMSHIKLAPEDVEAPLPRFVGVGDACNSCNKYIFSCHYDKKKTILIVTIR